MQKLHLLGICLLAVVAFPINSCRKVDEMKFLLENGRADLRQCSIQHMSQLLLFSAEPTVTLTFTYNNRKDPVSVIPDLGPFQWLLSYDKNGRLSQFMVLRGDGHFEIWHVYLYDNKGRIIGDSAYREGLPSDRNTALARWLSNEYYDHLERVIKETQISPGINISVEYTYNNQGNLISRRISDNGQISIENIGSYVNEASVLLTNHIWRYLARDYSLNSRSYAYSLNEHGLAIEYRGTDGHDIGTFFFGSYEDTQLVIQYDCQDAPDIAK